MCMQPEYFALGDEQLLTSQVAFASGSQRLGLAVLTATASSRLP